MASHRGWGGRAVSGGWDSGDQQPSLPSHSPPSSHGSKPGSARSTTARAAAENRGRPRASKRVGVQDRPNLKRASKAAPNKRARRGKDPADDEWATVPKKDKRKAKPAADGGSGSGKVTMDLGDAKPAVIGKKGAVIQDIQVSIVTDGMLRLNLPYGADAGDIWSEH